MNYFKPEFDRDHLAQLSSLALAHIGDSVFELMARCAVIHKYASRSAVLHKKTVAVVCADAQAAAAEKILPLLTEDELAVFMRGRNAKPKSVPKNTSHRNYSMATALEVLFGWLYLNGETERLDRLFEIIAEQAEL